MRPEMMQVRMWSLSRQVRMDRPRKVTANRSLGPNWRAAAVSGWDSRNIAMAETRPPNAEASRATPRALPASPRCAMG